MGANVRTGVYRHYKGGLFQVLDTLWLTNSRPVGDERPRADDTLYTALDATNGADYQRLTVVRFQDARWAFPVDAPLAELAHLLPPPRTPAVLYMGLTLDGATPGPRLRVRMLGEFNGQRWSVPWPDGAMGPRFRRVAEDWSPDR